MKKIVLSGNPNSGKTTLFNALTGLRQKVGNYPGVTVDKKSGGLSPLYQGSFGAAEIIDLPGAYSLSGHSEDEKICAEVLKGSADQAYDAIVYVADASNLKRSLYFFSQIVALDRPVVVALNMGDMAQKKGISIDCVKLSEKLGVEVIPINARSRNGLDELIAAIGNAKSTRTPFSEVGENAQKKILNRYKAIDEIIGSVSTITNTAPNRTTARIDAILTHPVWGLLTFLLLLFVVFQAIFNLAEYPMGWIEQSFVAINELIDRYMEPGILTDLIANGIVAGLSGVVIFIPQIALLFLFIAILEDSGYMARVGFILDSMLKRFGLNGKSVIPLISGYACAVPAVMSARTIQNRSERLLTIMVTPLMTCSARLPVYVLLIGLVIPDRYMMGIFNIQGLVLMGLYLIGFFAALAVSWLMKHMVHTKEKAWFILEMPDYQWPQWSNIGLMILEKVRVFVFEAGKIILAISILLWVLSSFGPGETMREIEDKYADETYAYQYSPDILQANLAAEKLENSYAGRMGKFIEPVIAPLGYDWKIGIALITSFAAREVFVGTMATIFSVGDADDTLTIRDKMQRSKHMATGLPVYTLATAVSLMVFYAFAMQCMSTIAIVYRETKHWKWPLIQLLYMTALAYGSAWLAQVLLG